jgi:hypothetical protein
VAEAEAEAEAEAAVPPHPDTGNSASTFCIKSGRWRRRAANHSKVSGEGRPTPTAERSGAKAEASRQGTDEGGTTPRVATAIGIGQGGDTSPLTAGGTWLRLWLPAGDPGL